MRSVCLIAVIIGSGVWSTGCSENRIVYKTRHIPRVSELSWDKEYEQLPWQPPAVTEHRPYKAGRSPIPGFAPTTDFNVEFSTSNARHRTTRELENMAELGTYQEQALRD